MLKDCAACPLAVTRTQVVLPDGPEDADIVLVGEAPGADEDKEGRPFVGKSGRKLDWLLERGGLSRDRILITNTVLCHPPGNRNPAAAELKACRTHLDATLTAHPRRAILTVGDIATKQVGGKGISLKHQHGRRIEGSSPAIIPLYHPAAALHNPNLTPTLIADYRRLSVELERISVTRGTHVTTSSEELGAVPQEFAFDLETTLVKDRVGDVDVVGYSLAFPGADHAYFLRETPQAPLFEGSKVVCHNAQFEYQVMKERGVTLRNLWDTKLAAYLLGYPNTRLKALTLQIFGYTMHTLEELTNNFKSGVEDVPDAALADYGADDAFWTLKLKEVLMQELEAAGLTTLYETLELPLIPVLGDMMLVGIGVDREALKFADVELGRLAAERETTLHETLGPINLNSADQLAEVLFGKLDYPVIKRTEGGKRPSTDKEVLELLAQLYPVAQELLDYRHIVKLKSTYAEGIYERIGDRDRLFAHFNQAGGFEDRDAGSGAEAPRTGRLSSSGPNLTNIPKHDAPGLSTVANLIRRCFIPSRGHMFVVGDMSQEEFRVAAFLSNDPVMLDIIYGGRDWHRETALEAFGHEPTGEERYYGKQANFSKLNGAGPAKIAHVCKVSRDMGQVLSDGFDRRYARYLAWREEEAEKLVQTGYATTYYGRRRYLPAVWAGDKVVREEAIRQGINTSIQGSAADILKLVMRRMWERLQGHEARLVSCVHDELVVEALDREVEYVIGCFKGLTNGLLGVMPLPVEVKTGLNWADASSSNPNGLRLVS